MTCTWEKYKLFFINIHNKNNIVHLKSGKHNVLHYICFVNCCSMDKRVVNSLVSLELLTFLTKTNGFNKPNM